MMIVLLMVVTVLAALVVRQAAQVVGTRSEHGGLYASWRALGEQNARELNSLLLHVHISRRTTERGESFSEPATN